ncbi:MAG: inorganic phosphate transporter [Planctomycetes bacterium]|nr:inorganic phosphate transporter [Planctomycetota bacterium]
MPEPQITPILVLVIGFALIFDVTNGFHDAGNAVAAAIGTRVLTPGVAILMAAVMDFTGALLSTNVARTISSGLIQTSSVAQTVVLSAVLGAICWNLITWYFGIPSSSTHALIGGLVGAAMAAGDWAGILWNGLVFKVLIPMLTSPFIGAVLGLAVLAAFLICFRWMTRRQANAFFPRLQVLTAAVMALAHGMSDAQKSMGLITMALIVAGFIAPQAGQAAEIPLWVIVACAAAIGLGTAMGGRRIIKTMGNRIFRMEPVHGTAAQIAGAATIMTMAHLAMPVSTTHVITGGIFGVGMGKRARAVRWHVAGQMFLAWMLTVPGAGAVAAIVYAAIRLAGLK